MTLNCGCEISFPQVLKEVRARMFSLLDTPNFNDITGNSSNDEDKQFKHPVAVLAGGKGERFGFFDTDTNVTYFRQEPFFRYVFGVNEPDCQG